MELAMKAKLILIASVLLMSFGHAYAAQQVTKIASQGETSVVATSGQFSVRVKVHTHKVVIGKPSDKRPAISHSSCTYSKYPCSLVDGIDISVGANALFIPRSVFCDLADLNVAKISVKGSNATLILYGGDASESYTVSIEFDSAGIKRRVLASAMSPDQPLEETTYHSQVLGD
jgi:hypothetical protein